MGDVNLDGTVGFPDLLSLAQHYGAAAASWDYGDLNYDQKVDFTDLLMLAQHYNQSLPAAAVPPGAVPESAAAIVACAPLMLPRRRRSRGDDFGQG